MKGESREGNVKKLLPSNPQSEALCTANISISDSPGSKPGDGMAIVLCNTDAQRPFSLMIILDSVKLAMPIFTPHLVNLVL